MSHSSWGPGWPNAQTSKMKTLVRSDGLKISFRQEMVTLFGILIDETERRGYDVKVGQTWGFANRPISGTNTPSNHSWGLAIDINAPTNPRKRPKTTDIPTDIVDVWKKYGFRWGGDYVNAVPDTMHFEYMGSTADASVHTAQAARELKGIDPGVVGPGQPAPSTAWPGVFFKLTDPHMKGRNVENIQHRINAHSPAARQISVDGDFGKTTSLRVQQFQTAKRLLSDGIVGRNTWNALFT